MGPVRGERRHVDEVGYGGAKLDDLRRFGEADQDRPDAPCRRRSVVSSFAAILAVCKFRHDQHVGRAR